MRSGLQPTLVDPRDKKFAFHRLFGVAYNFPAEYDADNGNLPDQNLDRRYTECTAYTVADIGRDQDGFEYSHDYQFMKTLETMGVPPDSDGADLRTAFKVATVFGLLPASDEPDQMKKRTQAWSADQANWPLSLDSSTIKKPAYIPISPVPDWFDGIRSALVLGQSEKRTVGLGTKWFVVFNNAKDGILLENPKGTFTWHAYKISGWKTINGQPYLKAKPWCGAGYGDHGFVYLSRTLANRLMADLGTYGATLQDLPTNTVDELKALKVSYIEVAIAYMQNLVIRLQYALAG